MILWVEAFKTDFYCPICLCLFVPPMKGVCQLYCYFWFSNYYVKPLVIDIKCIDKLITYT